jgi:hypothetical protein
VIQVPLLLGEGEGEGVQPEAVVAPTVKFCRAYGWHTYNWTTYYQPAENGLIFATFTLATEADPTRLLVTYKLNAAGSVSIAWGTRTGGYSSRSTPQPAAANTTQTFHITELKRKTTYFVNATANVNLPNAAGGLPTVGSFQSGEVSLALP